MHAQIHTDAPPVQRLSARVFTVPTDTPEADGTMRWLETTVLVVEAEAGGETGLGFSYTTPAAASIVTGVLAGELTGTSAGSAPDASAGSSLNATPGPADALSPPAAWNRMRTAVRNLGYPGVAAGAISAVDVALWDLKARLLQTSLSSLLGRVRDSVPVYGSGGFTSYTDEQLEQQLSGWVSQGISMVKMKVGSQPERDPERVRRARAAIGPDAELFVDANGGYQRKQALRLAHTFAEQAGVSWFEEPVSSDDLDGLRLLRDRSPASISIAAGEYGYDLFDFRALLEHGAVDVLQADVTRCGGITQMLQVAALCAARGVPLSAHTSPALHAHVCSALTPVVHVEYFHDHVIIETLLFDGLPALHDGRLQPDPDAPGLGLTLREADARPYERTQPR